jgi:arylsulfatase A-like enzyme
MKQLTVFCITLATAFFTNLSVLAARPNILLVVADDYGVDSSSLYNTNSKASLPPTPTINSLVTNGVLFRNAYAYPTCSATRAALLTGRYGFRTGWGLAIAPGDTTVLLGNEPTLPKILTQNPQLGYRQASIGKWHLGFNPTDPNSLGGWPHFSGALSYGLDSYFRWEKIVDGVTSTSTTYATTDNVNDALSWIQQQGTNNWFLWLGFNAPHDPFHKPPNDLHSYKNLPTDQASIDANPRPYFEAMTEAMDTELGRLLKSIDRSNTVVIFVGDNGTPGEVIQPPYPKTRGKFTLYEGGIHVPMIISGPTVKNPNREATEPVHLIDLYSTILELAGADLNSALPAHVIFDSRSLMPFLTNDANVSRSWTFTEEFPDPAVDPGQSGRAIRDEALKVIHFANGSQSIFDLNADPTEQKNLVGHLTAEQSARIDTLNARLAELQNFPRITDLAYVSNKVALSVDYIQGVQFSLRRTDAFPSSSWRTISAAQRQTNYSVVLTDPIATNHANYYRVSTPAR